MSQYKSNEMKILYLASKRNMIQYFSLIGALYIETIGSKYIMRLPKKVLWFILNESPLPPNEFCFTHTQEHAFTRFFNRFEYLAGSLIHSQSNPTCVIFTKLRLLSVTFEKTTIEKCNFFYRNVPRLLENSLRPRFFGCDFRRKNIAPH